MPHLIQCNARSGSSLLLATEAFRALYTLSAPARLNFRTGLQGSNLRLFLPETTLFGFRGLQGPWPFSRSPSLDLPHASKDFQLRFHPFRGLRVETRRRAPSFVFSLQSRHHRGERVIFACFRHLPFPKNGFMLSTGAAPTSMGPPFPGFLQQTAADLLPGLSQMLACD